MRKNRFLYCIYLLIICVSGGIASPPDVSLYFRNAEFAQFKISPDGKQLAVLAPWEGYMNLFNIDLETRQPRILTGEKLDITYFNWANSDRLIYSMNQGDQTSKSRFFGGGLFGVDKDGSNITALILPWTADPKDGVKLRSKNYRLTLNNLYPEDDRYIMVNNHQRRARYPDLYLMNVKNAKMKVFLRNPGRVNTFYTDRDGNPVLGIEVSDKMDIRYLRYNSSNKKEKWRDIRYFEKDYNAWDPMGLEEKDGQLDLLIASNHESDKKQLYWIDLETGELGDSIFSDPVYDVAGNAMRVIGSESIAGFTYDQDKPKKHFFNKEMEKLHELLDEALPDAHNTLTSIDLEGKKAIVKSISDRHAPRYFLLTLDDLNLELLANSMEWVNESLLTEQLPVSFKARDGWMLHGYLYLPENYSPDHPVPLIVNPHGGPWARDTWGIQWWHDLEPHFLASRGFAVLKVNFRGSTGYGTEHLKQSFKNLETMHNDVIDGVRWAIREGYAESTKIGIMGASWGGYATMTALVKEPGMFQFGINIFGVVDLVEHIRTYREWDREAGYNYWLDRIGDPGDANDRKNLEEWSAINYIENIDVPVFVYHGLRDFNVDIEQSRLLVRKLNGLGKIHTVIFREDEAHSAFDEENRIEFYRALDDFIKPFAPAWKEQ